MTGRLTLSWANKDKALLSHGETGYEWVERDDPRVREVRLLDEVGRTCEVSGDASDNLLIRGDSVDALRALVHSPEYAAHYRGKVKLVYIDPPFNTGQAFEHYDDSLEHSVWLGMMRERLVLIRELLAPDGSVWVHLDDAEMAYCKVLMDEVFGRANFVATVVWQKVYSPDNRTHIAPIQDYLLVYAAWEPGFKAVRNLIERTDAQLSKYKNLDDDPRGPWKTVDFSAQSGRATKDQFYTLETPAGRKLQPPRGRAWVYTERRYEELVADGRVWFGRDGKSGPALKSFLTEVQQGVVPASWWTYDEVGHNQEAKKEVKALFPDLEPFDTPKPERLLERVIHIATNPGDIVLDAFAGSGTTAAVAHKMGRRWVTTELSDSTVDTFTKPRLQKVVDGTDPGGITESTGWTGGGGFRDLRVAASIWDVIVDKYGTVALAAERVTPAHLGRAVAAQLGFLPIEHDTFVGAKGRSRLAVLEGVADAVAVHDIVSALAEGETAVIAALAVTDDAETTLRDLSRGSRLVKLPIDLFPSTSRVTT